jgi:hypothetical protein
MKKSPRPTFLSLSQLLKKKFRSEILFKNENSDIKTICIDTNTQDVRHL